MKEKILNDLLYWKNSKPKKQSFPEWVLEAITKLTEINDWQQKNTKNLLLIIERLKEKIQTLEQKVDKLENPDKGRPKRQPPKSWTKSF